MKRVVGKLIGGLLVFPFGPLGLMLGLAVGHAYDMGVFKTLRGMSPANLELAQKQFFDTTFKLLGYVAKSDGRVSEAEIAQAEALFRQLRMTPEQRQSAIEQFQNGARAGFDPAATVRVFAAGLGRRRQVQQTLFAFLASMALADGALDTTEKRALYDIAALFDLPTKAVDRIVAMLIAQSQFHAGGAGPGAGSPDPDARLRDAYQALGVSAEDADAVIKKSYRRLMSENHPDKLVAKGVPDEMIKLATARSQDISSAYAVIKTARGFR